MDKQKKIILGLIAVVVLGGLIYAFTLKNKSQDTAQKAAESAKKIAETHLKQKVFVTTNPDETAGDGIALISGDLMSTIKSWRGLSNITSIESIDVDKSGKAFITASLSPTEGAVIMFNEFEKSNEDLGAGSSIISGTATGLQGPKGVYYSKDLKSLFVADFVAKNIKVFAGDATGNATPLATLSLGEGTRSVWDMVYEDDTDTLYATGTDGTVLAYDEYSKNLGKDGPTRLFTPSDQSQKISINLHGINTRGTSKSDYLILSDVGDPKNATDGQLFVIENPKDANGDIQVMRRIAGSQTRLGNPVDLEVEGEEVYVAEKSNDFILRFDTAFTSGDALQDIAPDKSFSYPKPESISLP